MLTLACAAAREPVKKYRLVRSSSSLDVFGKGRHSGGTLATYQQAATVINFADHAAVCRYQSRSQVPELCHRYQRGEISLDAYITHRFKLEDINEAFHLLHEGACLRAVIDM